MRSSRGISTALLVVIITTLLCCVPRASRADVFSDLGDGLMRVTGLRGAVQSLAGGAGEGIREELDRFVAETVDPMLGRIDRILADRIDHAAGKAIAVVHELERALQRTLQQAQVRIAGLTAGFFAELRQTLDDVFARAEDLLDRTLCRIAPDGTFHVALGPFGGTDEIKIRRPAQTHCYANTLAGQGDPDVAVFRKWEYFRGELCEHELKLARISPADPNSIEQVTRGYQRLAEMAESARCAAPDAKSKADMAMKLYRYQTRATFFGRLGGEITP